MSREYNYFLFFTALLVSWFSALQALALAPSFFDNKDDEPIEITSHNANFDEKTGNTTYQGDVHAFQGMRHLWSESLVIHRTREGKIDHIIAKGSPARFIAKTKPEVANTETIDNDHLQGKANVIHYYPDEKKIIFLQNAELSENGRSIQGAHLIYHIEQKTLISENALGSKTVVHIQPKNHNNGKSH